MSEEIEIWKPVIGYEDFYEVSSWGRVKSKDRMMGNKGGNLSKKPGRVLKGREINSGSVMVTLTVNRQVRAVLLHRLVAEHFLPEYSPNLQVLHKDSNRTNNRADNLRIGADNPSFSSLTPAQWLPIDIAPNGKDIIVYSPITGVDKMFRNGSSWYHRITDDPTKPWPYPPTHWMPLPEPPKE